MDWLRRCAGWAAAGLLLLWRRTCRYSVSNDPRPALRAKGTPYIYALLHAHQVAALFVNDEQSGRLAAMVSRSNDGDVLVPSLTARGVLASRGSSRRRGRDKGGRQALEELAELLEQRIAVLLAVDGPQGPRGAVKPGVAALVQRVEGAAVLPTLVLSSRKFALQRTWDRFQLPLPFARVSLVFDTPIVAEPGEDPEALRARVEKALLALEREHDPDEAAYSQVAG